MRNFSTQMEAARKGIITEELKKVEGEFSVSTFVKKVTGVDNVCERSALADTNGTLVCGKRIWRGVTVALAAERKVLRF